MTTSLDDTDPDVAVSEILARQRCDSAALAEVTFLLRAAGKRWTVGAVQGAAFLAMERQYRAIRGAYIENGIDPDDPVVTATLDAAATAFGDRMRALLVGATAGGSA